MASESSQSYGKRQEFAAIAEMIKRGLDVYVTLVDDKGIDCVVRRDSSTYYDVQIKARSKNVKYPGNFSNLDISEPRWNYVFVVYCEKPDKFWVIPSERITGSHGDAPLGTQIKPGRENEGKWWLDVWHNGKTESGFEVFENAWHHLGANEKYQAE